MFKKYLNMEVVPETTMTNDILIFEDQAFVLTLSIIIENIWWYGGKHRYRLLVRWSWSFCQYYLKDWALLPNLSTEILHNINNIGVRGWVNGMPAMTMTYKILKIGRSNLVWDLEFKQISFWYGSRHKFGFPALQFFSV